MAPPYSIAVPAPGRHIALSKSTEASRIFAEEIARLQERQAKARGHLGETGAITFVQRFNAALGCFVHFHVMVRDGVFVREGDDAITFHEGAAPSREDIATVAARVDMRVRRWLRRAGLVD